MGYAADYFSGVAEPWLDKGWLPVGGKLIEFGAQEFYCDQDEARSNVERFLAKRGKAADEIASVVGSNERLSVAAIYRSIGIDYTAVDVDEAYGSTFFDLNSFAPPLAWRAAFDLINNEGTIEHLINPINGFQVAHELAKVGGVIVHSMPLTGWRDHGMTYPTIKFYAELIGANRYEILQSDLFVGQSALDFTDNRFRLIPSNGLDLDAVKLTDVWMRLAYRKTQAKDFRAPYDHLVVENPAALGERLSGTFSAYSRMRPTASQQRDRIGDDFEREAELQRRGHEQGATLQQREHAHADRMLQAREAREKRETQEPREAPAQPTDPMALLATALTMLFNGAALLMLTGSGVSRAAFAVGLAAAAAPTAMAWTQLPAQRSQAGRVARYGSRMLWALSVALFIAGAFVA